MSVSGSIIAFGLGLLTENTSITLTYKKPDGSMLDRTVTTGSGGSYVDYYKPDTAGSWSVTATWHGDSAFEGASSLPISFTITDGGPSTPAPIGFEVILGGMVSMIIIAAIVYTVYKMIKRAAR